MTVVRSALREKSALLPSVKEGLGALEKAHRGYIEEALRKDFADSLEVDENLRRGRESENRWDYLLGHEPSEAVVGFEPHSAANKEVPTVIAKREHAKRQLQPHLRDGVVVKRWYWVASGKVDLMPMDKKVIQLAQNGITFVGKRLLAKELAKLVPAPKPPRTAKR